ncbi:uncharacterized protein LOC142351598 [Convolutriloba macropyga]|uniref:uncharacterized protein LOC142351598 n=1 Tax=Convolutriloba macropyga TaxID=536237 RepID=UPI003F523B00
MATVSVESSSQHLCENGTTYINGSELSVCFYLVDVALGTMNQTDATQRCDEHYPGSTVVALTDKAMLTMVIDWAIKEGLPTDSEAGFWTIYKREEAAPLESNGTLSQTNEDIRKNRNLFVRWFGSFSTPMFNGGWRNETQPGNTLDARDERCTAQSRPGKQPEYVGLDDYECNGTQLHYAICQVLFAGY